MKRLGKFLTYAFLAIILLLVAGITATIGWRPFIGPRARPLTNRTFERTPARLERGRYLATSVTGCFYCHSPHDWTQHAALILPGMTGAGARFPEKYLPGQIYAPNITSDPETGAGNWTDDQLARAIREGIGHDGRALFPLMQYPHLRDMFDEDLASVVVYVRSLPAVKNPVPRSEIIFPVKYLIRGVPQPVTASVPEPDKSTPEKRGAYLVDIGGCTDCHTPEVKGQPIPGMDFAGGFPFDGPWGKLASANITQDPSGISYYDEALFIQAMRTGYVRARKLSQVMPWQVYGSMTDEDLKAVFAYLKTVKPVSHRVDNTEAATMCKKCGAVHGLGSSN